MCSKDILPLKDTSGVNVECEASCCLGASSCSGLPSLRVRLSCSQTILNSPLESTTIPYNVGKRWHNDESWWWWHDTHDITCPLYTNLEVDSKLSGQHNRLGNPCWNRIYVKLNPLKRVMSTSAFGQHFLSLNWHGQFVMCGWWINGNVRKYGCGCVESGVNLKDTIPGTQMLSRCKLAIILKSQPVSVGDPPGAPSLNTAMEAKHSMFKTPHYYELLDSPWSWIFVIHDTTSHSTS